MLVLFHLFEQRNLAQGRHRHALFRQRHTHFLQRHHLTLVGRISGFVHRSVSTWETNKTKTTKTWEKGSLAIDEFFLKWPVGHVRHSWITISVQTALPFKSVHNQDIDRRELKKRKKRKEEEKGRQVRIEIRIWMQKQMFLKQPPSCNKHNSAYRMGRCWRRIQVRAWRNDP